MFQVNFQPKGGIDILQQSLQEADIISGGDSIIDGGNPDELAYLLGNNDKDSCALSNSASTGSQLPGIAVQNNFTIAPNHGSHQAQHQQQSRNSSMYQSAVINSNRAFQSSTAPLPNSQNQVQYLNQQQTTAAFINNAHPSQRTEVLSPVMPQGNNVTGFYSPVNTGQYPAQNNIQGTIRYQTTVVPNHRNYVTSTKHLSPRQHVPSPMATFPANAQIHTAASAASTGMRSHLNPAQTHQMLYQSNPATNRVSYESSFPTVNHTVQAISDQNQNGNVLKFQHDGSTETPYPHWNGGKGVSIGQKSNQGSTKTIHYTVPQVSYNRQMPQAGSLPVLQTDAPPLQQSIPSRSVSSNVGAQSSNVLSAAHIPSMHTNHQSHSSPVSNVSAGENTERRLFSPSQSPVPSRTGSPSQISRVQIASVNIPVNARRSVVTQGQVNNNKPLYFNSISNNNVRSPGSKISNQASNSYNTSAQTTNGGSNQSLHPQSQQNVSPFNNKVLRIYIFIQVLSWLGGKVF